jgi:hypothetical protein
MMSTSAVLFQYRKLRLQNKKDKDREGKGLQNHHPEDEWEIENQKHPIADIHAHDGSQKISGA